MGPNRREVTILKFIKRAGKLLFIFLLLLALIPGLLWLYLPQADFGTASGLRGDLLMAASVQLGVAEGSDAHHAIIDTYNAHEPLAQGYEVKYEDDWCATFVSAVAIQQGLTDIIPTECGCQRQIGLFQEIARWEEDDSYIPLPGDIIYYCNGDKDPFSDCKDWSDHVGLVVGTSNGYIKVIEGNCDNTVAYRYIKVNSTGIRGFALPDYEGFLAGLEDA